MFFDMNKKINITYQYYFLNFFVFGNKNNKEKYVNKYALPHKQHVGLSYSGRK